jgi:hypothetical protein
LHNLLSSQLDEILFSLAHKAYLINWRRKNVFLSLVNQN